MADTPQRGKHFKVATSAGESSSGAQVAGGSQSAPAQPSAGAYQGTGFIGQDQRKGRRNSGKRRVSRIVSNVLIIVGVVLLVAAGALWLRAQLQYKAQDEINEQLAAYASTLDEDADASVVPTIDWEGLKAINDDIVGWIYIPGTVVNYPVYQGDSNDTYLNTTATGEYSIGGQIFMDYENAAPGLIDRQTVIYGHHLYNGTMFTDVDRLADQDNFDVVTTVWYLTETATYELEPLYFYKTSADDTEARQLVFADDDTFHTYLSERASEATAKSSSCDAAVWGVSRVLTLATCDYENNFGEHNGRGLLVCALKEEVETILSGGAVTGWGASDEAAEGEAVEGEATEGEVVEGDQAAAEAAVAEAADAAVAEMAEGEAVE